MRLLHVLHPALVVLIAIAPVAHAQRTARIEGDVTDSLHAKPLAGATVLVSRIAPASSDLFTTLTDDRGRFHVDSLEPGRYGVSIAHPILDSLDLVMPPREVALTDGERARVALALPSGATLRARACPGISLPASTGAVVGQVEDAEHEQPLGGATIVLDWMDLGLDRATMHPTQVPRSVSVRTDSSGAFRFCGVPTETYLLLQVQRAQRVGSPIRLTVPDTAGIAVLRLSYSEASSRPFAAADTTREADALPPLVGTATLTGIVHTAGGAPLGGVEVRVVDAASTARTDAEGRFTLGSLPAGTQVIEARRVGYLVAQQRVDLRPGRSASAELLMRTVVTLDSVRVLAQRSRYRESAERQRRFGGTGTFMNEEQIARAVASQTSDLFTRMGYSVSGDDLDAKVYVRRGRMSLVSGGCAMNVVIDGMQHQDVNLVQPGDIGMMELYKGPAGAPMEYDSACGVIVIWTKR